MRYLLTFLLCLFTLSLTAQETITYPYNPDSDNDAFVASTDLLELLGLYGDAFSPAEIMIGDTGLVQWVQILSQTLQAQQELINQLQSDYNALPDGIFSGDILRWNGTAWIPESPPVDDCGVISGDNSTCADCCGVPNGDGSTCDGYCGTCNDNSTCLDECGVPNGDNSTCTDYCGVVNGDNSSCLDECGVPNGDNSTCTDYCGVVNGDNSSCLDECGVPNGGGSSCVFESCGDQIGHENYVYSTVQIGDQCWFSENCRYLPEVSPSSEGSGPEPYYYVHSYQGSTVEEAKATENYDTYGALYNWPAVMTGDICPSGWHVPSDDEFTQLTDFLGEEGVAGDAMKAGTWISYGEYGQSYENPSNSSGFTGLSGGSRRYPGNWSNDFDNGHWWTSSEFGSSSWMRSLYTGNDVVDRNFSIRNYGYSARCLQDYIDECGVLNGASSSCTDCCGVLNGDGSTCDDDCGACNDNSSCLDCAGVLNGSAVIDTCGVCGGDGSSCVFESCGDQIGHENYAYSTVQIGDQCWFSENCRYLPSVSNTSEGNATDPYYYVYGYQGNDVTAAKETSNYETYGVLYNWPAVMTEGICPSGWHITSDGEFQTMEMSLGMSEAEASSTGWRGTDEGYQMKSTSGWGGGGNGSNSSGFTGLPGGSRSNGVFNNVGYLGFWWTASESGANSWSHGLSDEEDFYTVNRSVFNPVSGFSARCVRD